MNKLKTPGVPWTDLSHVLQGNGTPGPGATSCGTTSPEHAAWQRMIDQYLLPWAADTAALTDEEVVPPSDETLRLACQVAENLRDAGVPAPHRVAATGDGGIVFARQAGASLSTLEIDADGSVELAEFHDARLVSRQRLR